MLGHGRRRDQPARAVGLAQHEAAVTFDLGHRKTHVVVARYQPPIGEVAAVTLRAALDDVSGDGARRGFTLPLLRDMAEACYRRGILDELELKGVLGENGYLGR